MPWGAETRAADGCIVTFLLASGETQVESFTQKTISRGGYYTRVRTRIGTTYIEQAAARADALGARVLSISTPTTILRDLDGTREELEPHSDQGYVRDELQMPERRMLSGIGRLDLLVQPTRQRDWASESIQHVTARKSAHSGPRGQ
jgi:hypothetical protein